MIVRLMRRGPLEQQLSASSTRYARLSRGHWYTQMPHCLFRSSLFAQIEVVGVIAYISPISFYM